VLAEFARASANDDDDNDEERPVAASMSTIVQRQELSDRSREERRCNDITAVYTSSNGTHVLKYLVPFEVLHVPSSSLSVLTNIILLTKCHCWLQSAPLASPAAGPKTREYCQRVLR
jgi:hypothetical protein